MKIIFLLPPSEGKNSGGDFSGEKLSFKFEKPCEIAKNVSEKDLKCKGERFKEALELNKTLCEGKQKEFKKAINRYSGVMYNFINYENMTGVSKKFFEENFLIFSGMYGILKPTDIIGNYKLPLEKADLYKFWWDKIPEKIIEIKPDFIINLLPINYAKLIGLGTNCNRHKKKLEKIINSGIKIVNINFLKEDGKKISHGVKKIKGEWIKNICEKNIQLVKTSCGQYNYGEVFGGKVVELDKNIIDINIIK